MTTSDHDPAHQQVLEIDTTTLAATLGSRRLVDVREPAEFATGHVPGAANWPMAEFPERLAALAPGNPASDEALTLICRSGNRSGAMAQVAAAAGHPVTNVLGGTTAWLAEGRALASDLPELTVRVVETPTLGNRSYLVHDGSTALVIDPQRDIDRMLDLIAAEGVQLTHVFETHIHNDYVTGGFALAAATGAEYLVNAQDEVSFQRTRIHADETVPVGPRMLVTALATPGHTFTHLSYALTDAATGTSVGVFTGGSLLFGATGRPDLLGAEHAETLAHHQHHSAHHLVDSLPDEAAVWPTHGFGSFCSATPNDGVGDSSTLGLERRRNSVLSTEEDVWVRDLLAQLNAWPAYYAHMAPANVLGPDAPDLSLPQRADADEIRTRLDAGEWVVDLRNRTAFAAGHTPGALNIGLDGSFVTYLGWLIEQGTPLTLLGETPEQVAEAQRELVRIGIDPDAHATGGPEDWTTGPLVSHRTATFADLADLRHHRTVRVLDVRRSDEFAAAHVDGAQNVPLHELIARLDEVADVSADQEIWVHCAGGYRASIAASILAAHGLRPVAVDDSFDAADAVGLIAAEV